MQKKVSNLLSNFQNKQFLDFKENKYDLRPSEDNSYRIYDGWRKEKSSR